MTVIDRAVRCSPLLTLCCVVALASAATAAPQTPQRPAPADSVWICAPPKKGPLDPCPKGRQSSRSTGCRERYRGRRKSQPKFRIGYGRTLTISKREWTCVRWPRSARPVRVQLVNYGKPYAWLKPRWAGCKSGRVDIVYHEFYGSAYSKCSRRKSPHASARTRLIADYPVVLKRPVRAGRGKASIIVSSMTVDQVVSRTPVFDAGG